MSDYVNLGSQVCLILMHKMHSLNDEFAYDINKYSVNEN